MSTARKKAIDMIQTLPEDDGTPDIPNDETIEAISENEEARKSGNVTTWNGSTAELFNQIGC